MPLENDPVPSSTEPSPAYETTSLSETQSIIFNTALYPQINYANSTTPLWSEGGSATSVNSVSAGAGMVVSPTTGNVVVSMPNVGSAGTVQNPASITTDAQGRITNVASLGYVPVSPSDLDAYAPLTALAAYAPLTALAAYAPLAGATFTGPIQATNITGTGQVRGNTVLADAGLTVNSGTADLKLATTVQVPLIPTLPASATSKQYVDSLVPSLTGYAQLAAPNTFTADNSFTGATTAFTVGESAAAPIDEFQVWAKDVNLRNTDPTNVFNLTSAGLMSVSAGSGLSVNSAGLVNLTATVGNITAYSALGDVKLGGPLNNITVSGNNVSTDGLITAAEVNISNGTDTGNVLDSQFNPPTITNAITTKGIRNQFADQNGNPVYSATLDTTANMQILGMWSFAGNTKFNMNTAPNQPALFYNTLNTFRLSSSGSGPTTGVVLPAVPADGSKDGTIIGVENAIDSPGGNFSLFAADGSTILKSVAPGATFYCQMYASQPNDYVINTTLGGSYIPLAGTAVGQSVSGPVVFDTAANIQCLDIQTGLISALPDVDFISVEDPMQTRELGVRSADGILPATIAMALSESSLPPDILTMTYNSAAADLLEINKGVRLSGDLYLNGAGPGQEKSIVGVYGIDTVNVKAKDILSIDESVLNFGDSIIHLKTYDPAFAGEGGTIVSMTYPDSTTQNAVLYARGALSLVDPPNGGLPAQILINGVPQTLNGSDWSSYPPTQNLDMASFNIDNAGTIGATSVSTTDFITSDTTITGLDVVGTNSVSGDSVIATTTLTVGATDVGGALASLENIVDFKPNATLYVAKNGNDITGNGSILQPYQTIQKAYDIAKLTSSSANIFEINIAAGHYTENLNIVGKTYVWFVGAVPQGTLGGVGETTEIIGSITINANIPGGDDLYNKVCGFINLQISGSITVDSVNESSLVIKDCKIYSSDRAVYVNPTATDYRTYISNTAIQHQSAGVGTNSLVEITNGWLYASGGAWTALNNSSILTISGTGTAIQVGQVIMESDNSSTSLAPIVSITTTNTTTNTFGQCSMIAINAAVKTTPAILINSATPPTLNLLQNYFGISGTSAGGNVIQYSGTAPTLQVGGNASQFGTSAVIQSGITSVPTTGVGLSAFSAINSAVSAIGVASGTSLTTTGAIKSSGTLQLSGNAITNASNNTTISGVSAITGSSCAVSGINTLAITNTNSTVPLTITNNNAGGSPDNPHLALNVITASTTIPTEFQFNNGITSAIGNQNTDPRGSIFFFTNAKDVLRCQSSLLRLQLNYSPYSPLFATSGTAGAYTPGATTAWVSGVPKLLGTETITLSASNFPIIPGGFGTPAYVGINGYLNTVAVNAAHEFLITATYTRTRSGTTIGPFALYGCSYPTATLANGSFYTPINGTTYNEAVVGERITFTHGDILAIQIYGTFSGGGSAPTTTNGGSGVAAVLSPFF